MCSTTERTRGAIVRALERPCPKFLLHRAVEGWGVATDGGERVSDLLLTALVAWFVRRMYRVKEELREKVPPIELSAARAAAEIGTADVRGVASALRRFVALGVLGRKQRAGKPALYWLRYDAIQAERGNFTHLTDAEFDALIFGARRHQRAISVVILGTRAKRSCAREVVEAAIRRENFGGGHTETEQGLRELEACGILTVDRSRLHGNSYGHTGRGGFTLERAPRRAALLKSARERTPGRPRKTQELNRTTTPERNRTRPRSETGRDPGAKPDDKEQREAVQRNKREETQQGRVPASPAAGAGVVSASPGERQQQQPPLREALSVVARIERDACALGVTGAKNLDVLAKAARRIVEVDRVEWFDEWHQAARRPGVANPAGYLMTAIREALNNDAWRVPPSGDGRRPWRDPRRGTCYGATAEEIAADAAKYANGRADAPDSLPMRRDLERAHRLEGWRNVLNMPDAPEAEVLAAAREYGAKRQDNQRALEGLAGSVGSQGVPQTKPASKRRSESILGGDVAAEEHRRAFLRQQAATIQQAEAAQRGGHPTTEHVADELVPEAAAVVEPLQNPAGETSDIRARADRVRGGVAMLSRDLGRPTKGLERVLGLLDELEEALAFGHRRRAETVVIGAERTLANIRANLTRQRGRTKEEAA